MTDEMNTGPVARYPVPALRVAATYHGSDGRTPEDIVIEFGGDGPVDPALVDRAVRAIADVAARRDFILANVPDRGYTLAVNRAAEVNRQAAHEVAAAQATIAATRGAAGAPLVDRDALAAELDRLDEADRDAAEKVGVNA